MYPFSSISDYNLNKELRNLRRDLDQMNYEMAGYRGPTDTVQFKSLVELYEWKMTRLQALEAFSYARFVISNLEQTPMHPHTYAPTRAWKQKKVPRQRAIKQTEQQKVKHDRFTWTSAKCSNQMGIDEKILQNIKVEKDQFGGKRNQSDERNAQGNSMKKAKILMAIKIENIKKEIE